MALTSGNRERALAGAVDRRVSPRMPRRVVSVASLVFATAVAVTLAIDCGANAVPEPRYVSLDVNFKLTDLDYAPLAGQPVRLVFGSDKDWQSPGAGLQFTTDAAGSYHAMAHVLLDKRRRKLPTNFVDSLLSRNQITDHLMAAAELGYMSYRWLYAVDIYRFPGGDSVLLDPPSVYTPDAQGRFTQKARTDANGWHIPELGTMVLTRPGHEPWDFLLEPQSVGPVLKGWTLRLAFKRSPAPVVR